MTASTERIVSVEYLRDLEHALLHIKENLDSIPGAPNFAAIPVQIKRAQELIALGLAPLSSIVTLTERQASFLEWMNDKFGVGWTYSKFTAPDMSNAYLAGLRAIPSASAPTTGGWKFVPEEPTRGMLGAWSDTSRGVFQNYPSTRPGIHWSDDEARLVACYKAMLAAAPKTEPV